MKYIEELKELAKLKDDGILTEDEFQKKKEEILSNNSQSEPIAKKPSLNKTETTVTKKPSGLFSSILTGIIKSNTKTVIDLLQDAPSIKRQTKELDDSLDELRKAIKNA